MVQSPLKMCAGCKVLGIEQVTKESATDGEL